MNHPFYKNIPVSSDKNIYEFISNGKNGKIQKDS